MYKLRPGIFVGRLSASRRTLIWEHILKEQPDLDAVMCYDDAHGTISFLTTGSPTRYVSDEDGLFLLTFIHKERSDWQELLAKPSKPLFEHLTETGLMAKALLTESAYAHTTDLMMSYTDCTDKDAFISTVCFFIAMHDIGKIHPLFQKMMTDGEKSGFRHEEYSRYILREYLKEKGIKPRKDTYSSMYKLCNVVGDHHQCKEQDPSLADDYDEEIMKDNAYIASLMPYIEKMFPFTPFVINPDHENAFCQLMSGLLRCSDWSASSFADELKYEDDKSSYIRQIQDRCERYIREGHIETWQPDESYSYSRLFPFLTEETLHPLQKEMETVIRDHHTPDCILIEDQPGAGKTEASIYAAMSLMKSCHKQGLYFALPTGATAEAMLPRLKALQKAGLFTDTDSKLFTGTVWMRDMHDEESDEKAMWDDWTEKGPRKLFSSFACGTVDQLMTAGQKIKAADMRLFGLSDKVVIIDEFHSYDAYMMDALSVVLKWLSAMHVPVIIMSATLSMQTRKELFKIYTDDVSECEKRGYPRITVAENGTISSYFPESAIEKVYNIQLTDMSRIEDKILASVSTDGCTMYIANTVKNAYQMYKKLDEAKPDDVSLTLYTARTTPEVKEKMGEKLVYLYGKEGKADGKRPKKSIVIATQICEMSMDVDFDTIFSELAPIDALIQRFGREKRHDDKGTAREHGFKSIFYVVIPAKSDMWYIPYSKSVLDATNEVLKGWQTIKVPEDISGLIDTAYENAGYDWIKEQRILKAYGMADIMSLPRDKYKADKHLKSRIPTRYQGYETVRVICLPEEAVIQDDKKWCTDMVYRHSITMPEYIYEKIVEGDEADDKTLPVWIRGYHMVKDQDCFWGASHIFVSGLEE